jgi:hypothetical protein
MEQPSSCMNLKFEGADHDQSAKTGTSMKARVCVSCDCFLEYDETSLISVNQLKK